MAESSKLQNVIGSSFDAQSPRAKANRAALLEVLVGNIPTEVVLAELRNNGADLPSFGSLDTLLRTSHDISSRFGLAVQ